MPLSEQRRQQLDGIVQQMIQNKEPESNVQFVVNDFKSKYGNEQQVPPKEGFIKSTVRELLTPAARAGVTLGNSILATGKLINGDKGGANAALTKPVDVYGLGKVQPFNNEGKYIPTEQLGAGLQIGSTIAGGAGGSIKEPILSGIEKVAPKLFPFATKVLSAGKSVIPRAAEVGILGGGFEAGNEAQKGEGISPKKVAGAALTSSLFPLVGTGMAGIARLFTEAHPEAAARIVNSLVKPLAKDFAYGKNPGRAVAEEGIVARNFDELATKISSARQKIGEELGTIAQSPKYATKIIDNSHALTPIDEAITKASKNPRTNSTLIERLNNVKKDILGVTVDQNGQEIIGKDFSKMTLPETINTKTEIGDLTKWTGNKSDDEVVNKALKRAYGTLKENSTKTVNDPRFNKLNEKYADLTSAEIATKYRDLINQRQNLLSLGTKATAIGTGLVTAFHSGTVGPVLLGAGAAGLEHALGTPTVKTAVAKWLARATPEEKSAIFSQIPYLKNAISRVFGE